MLIEQRIWKARRGQRDALIALATAECARIALPTRILTPLTHPGDLLIIEYHFADLAEHARFWAAAAADPAALAYQRALADLVEPQHRVELFTVLWPGPAAPAEQP